MFRNKIFVLMCHCQQIVDLIVTVSRSQWPRGLVHELSSPARTLGSWVRIPLMPWIFVYVYSVLVLSRVGSCLETG
jgi:hypothetical protein